MRWIDFLYLAGAFMVGALLPVQAGINMQLTRWLNHPVQGAFVSFAVGMLALLFVCVAGSLAGFMKAPTLGQVSQVPWWMWTGGILGAGFVAGAIIVAARLGATTMAGWIIAGQLITSLLIDHYGWLGFPPHSVGWARIVGVALLMAGVLLIRLF